MKKCRPEFKHNCYIVTLEDLQGRVQDFPFNKILQYKYRTALPTVSLFIKPLRPILRAYRQGISTYDTTVKALEAEVAKIRALHPSHFRERGWYDTKCWEDLPGNEDLKQKRLAIRAKQEQERLQRIEDEKARVAAILSNKINFIKEIKALDCKVYTLSEIKRIARKLKIRGVSFYSINMELGGILIKTRDGYCLVDAREHAIRFGEKTYIDSDGDICLVRSPMDSKAIV